MIATQMFQNIVIEIHKIIIESQNIQKIMITSQMIQGILESVDSRSQSTEQDLNELVAGCANSEGSDRCCNYDAIFRKAETCQQGGR